jgi:uncharacterized protein (TIGR03435 family)
MRYVAVALLLSLGQASPKPVFEVAAIKRSEKLDSGGTLGLLPGGRFRAINWDARALIGVAYRTNLSRNLSREQIIGGPDWMSSERYDITAKINADLAASMDRPDRDPALMPKLVQSLLEDRFKLKMHYEKREMPVYALVVARRDGALGPQMHPSTTDCEKERPKCRLQFLTGHYTFGSATLDTLATSLSGPAGRFVLERTGLSGKFDLELEWAEEAGSDRPSIFAAVQEQLGLKLESTREPMDVVVIDHIERPTED